MRFWAEFSNYMTSGQRIQKYIEEASEGELKLPYDQEVIDNKGDADIDAKWPYKGGIQFKNVTMKYRENLEPAVMDLDFEI